MTVVLNDKEKHKNTTLVNLTQFNDYKLTYVHNATRKLRVSFLICNFVHFYTICELNAIDIRN